MAENITTIPRRIAAQDFERFELRNQTWRAIASSGVTLEDMLKPAYWSHVAYQMHPFDEIKVIAEDGSWVATLLVTNCERLWAQTVVVFSKDLTEQLSKQASAADDDLEVVWAAARRFRVRRKSDKETLAENFATAVEAEQWKTDYLKKKSPAA